MIHTESDLSVGAMIIHYRTKKLVYLSRNFFVLKLTIKHIQRKKKGKIQFKHQQGGHQSLLIACGGEGGNLGASHCFQGVTEWGGGGNQSSPTEYKGGYRKLTANQLPTMEGKRVIIRILQSLSRKGGGGIAVA